MQSPTTNCVRMFTKKTVTIMLMIWFRNFMQICMSQDGYREEKKCVMDEHIFDEMSRCVGVHVV